MDNISRISWSYCNFIYSRIFWTQNHFRTWSKIGYFYMLNILLFSKAKFNHIKHLQQRYFHSLHLLCLMQKAKRKYFAFSLLEPLFPVRFKQHMFTHPKFIPLLCVLLVLAHAGKIQRSKKRCLNLFSKWFRSYRCIDNTVHRSSDK